MDEIINSVGDMVRRVMSRVAKRLDALTGRKLSPNAVTIAGLIMHAPIAWLIATQHFVASAILLVVFGLFDTLDGALARLQHRDNSGGMLLDASADRMKEVILYIGAAYAIIAVGRPYMAVWAVAACGGSLLVSYVKAKGETAVAGKLHSSEVNKLFSNGLMRFEIRMLLLVLGLVSNRLILVVIVIAVLSWMTAVGRLIKISRKLAAGV